MPAPYWNFLLEDGFNLLLEDGGILLLEGQDGMGRMDVQFGNLAVDTTFATLGGIDVTMST